MKKALKEGDGETVERCSRELARKSETTRGDLLVGVDFVDTGIPTLRVVLPDFALADVGCVIWPAALALCTYLRTWWPLVWSPGDPPLRVLEVGCGVGVVGLFLWHMHLRSGGTIERICLSDFNAECVKATQANLAGLDNQQHLVRVVSMDWSDDSFVRAVVDEHLMGKVDLVLGAGVVYEPRHAQSVHGLLSRLKPRHALISVQTDHDGVRHFSDLVAANVRSTTLIPVLTQNGWPHAERECAVMWLT